MTTKNTKIHKKYASPYAALFFVSFCVLCGYPDETTRAANLLVVMKTAVRFGDKCSGGYGGLMATKNTKIHKKESPDAALLFVSFCILCGYPKATNPLQAEL